MQAQRTVRIGGASGFWGDSPQAGRQLLEAGVDYLVFDYLAEVTMAIMARARAKDPGAGYATDFVRPMLAGLLRDACERGVRIIANAGGVNPRGCRDAVLALAAEFSVSPKVAVVEGDDLMTQVEAMRAAGVTEIDFGTPFPNAPLSVNAYLGAFPIARAIAAGADIVITGRCVDSALALGPLIAEFGWAVDDYDRLAAGSLAGHVIECGCQATGGNFTDWREVSGWDRMGFPLIECSADGSFVIGKPAGTGGLITPLSVGEQVVYELGDPSSYLLPDVICDFTEVRLTQLGADRVRVHGAQGRSPGPCVKVSTTVQEGYRCTAMFTLVGRDAAAKARRVGESILALTERRFREAGFHGYRRSSLKVLGTEDQYGPLANPALAASREVVLRLDVQHDQRGALALFAQEIAPAGLAMAPGRCGLFGGRPTVSPVVGHAAFLWAKSNLKIRVDLNGMAPPEAVCEGSAAPPARSPDSALITMPHTPAPSVEPRPAKSPGVVTALTTESMPAPEPRGAAGRGSHASGAIPAPGPSRRVTLFELACARSGDKGDHVNIGVIARSATSVPVLRAQLTAQRVHAYFSHLVRGTVTRYEMPGMGAFNFVLTGALDGGGTRSLRNDPQGKAFAQMLLDIELELPLMAPSTATPAASTVP
jgi:hypothetical protein